MLVIGQIVVRDYSLASRFSTLDLLGSRPEGDESKGPTPIIRRPSITAFVSHRRGRDAGYLTWRYSNVMQLHPFKMISGNDLKTLFEFQGIKVSSGN